MIVLNSAVVAVATASMVRDIRTQKATPGDVSVYPVQAPRVVERLPRHRYGLHVLIPYSANKTRHTP